MKVKSLNVYINFIFLMFIYFWLCWVFIAVQAFLYVSGGYSLVEVHELLTGEASLVAEHRL